MANRYPLQQPQMQPRFDLSIGNNVPSTTMYPRPRGGIWPHQQPSQQLAEKQSEKHREYLKQQQRLRLMTASSTPQPVSADALIENLLGKKETFKPKSSHQGLTSGTTATNQHMMGSVVIPGMASPHMSAGVRPSMGYPIPTTAVVTAGPSTATGMMGGYGTSSMPLDPKASYSHVPLVPPGVDANVPTSQTQFMPNLPTWLNPSSQHLPQFYRQVWNLVGQDKGLVDTTRIFPLLLTSGLPTDILGFIWGLANRKIAGQLTEQELYVVLALVALAQSGCTFNNLGVLNLIPQPPIPNLKIVGFETMTSSQSRDVDVAANSGQVKMKREELNLTVGPSPTSFVSAPPPDVDDSGFDDFTDFQSAIITSTENVTSSNIKEVKPVSKASDETSSVAMPSNVIPDVAAVQKCPSVMVVSSSGHGRGIGSRLANHSLGTPKQKKTKHHHHHHHHRGQPQATANIAASVDEDFSDFQQAKDLTNVGGGNVDEIFPKCLMKTVPQGKTYLLKESAIRTESPQQIREPMKDVMSHEESQTFVKNNIREKISSEDSVGDTQEQSVTFEPKLTSGRETESVSDPTQSKSEGVNLMSIEEDKYSALRNISLNDPETSSDKPQLFAEQSPVSDDFGDFLSADPATVVDDSFADIALREQTSVKGLEDTASSDIWQIAESPQTAEFQVDDWGDYKDASTFDSDLNSNQNLENVESKWCESASNLNNETDISSTLTGLNLGGSSNIWSAVDPSTDLTPDGKEKFQGAVETLQDLNLEHSWDLQLKYNADNNINTSEKTGQGSSFEGFMGKLYDVKNEDYSSKIDVFCSSPDDQLHSSRDNTFDIGQGHHDVDDDFGDFVASDTWQDEQKFSATAKDILFDGHLGSGLKDAMYSDSQSVSSLELPPLALSRHGSVPSLDLKIFPSTADKNGGNGGHQPWDMSPQGIDHQLSEWQRCLKSCLTLLQSAVEIFNNISSGEVLDEVVGSAEGKDYLNNLLEVAGVSHRVECSYKQLSSGGEYKQLDSLLADIDNAWSSLESYYVKADISIDLEFDPATCSGDGTGLSIEAAVCCGVCLTDVGASAKTEARNTSQLEYGGHVYHSVCANLWVNCVDSSLPALATGNNSFL